MNIHYILISILFLIITSCKEKKEKTESPLPVTGNTKEEISISSKNPPKAVSNYTDFENALIENSLKDIQQLDSTINVDLKYATADNFTGVVLYTKLSHAFLQDEAAKKLVDAQKKLKEKAPELSLLVYDAVRPNSVQYKMWDLVVNTPKERYVAEPGSGSLHNFGGAVDLTIVRNGIPLDMGTPYDFFGKKAQPRYNQFFLDRKELSPEQVANRTLLRNVMKAAGFTPINSEWWHFNAFSLAYAKKHYKIVK